jgi:hypothetical protein
VTAVGAVGEALGSVPVQSVGTARAHPQTDGAPPGEPGLLDVSGKERADFTARAQQRTGVRPAVREDLRGHAPLRTPALGRLVGTPERHRPVRLGLRPLLGVQSGLARVIEGPEHRPAIDVAQSPDAALRARQVAPTQSCISGEQSGVAPGRRLETRILRGGAQSGLDLGRIGPVPQGPEATGRQVRLGAAGGRELEPGSLEPWMQIRPASVGRDRGIGIRGLGASQNAYPKRGDGR